MMATVVDGGPRTALYHGGGYGHHPGVDCTPPPPIPARLYPHHTREPRPATALGHGDTDSGYLAPVTARRGRGLLLDAGGVPPLPPRQPLRRSVSLTHRVPPDPHGADAPLGGPGGQMVMESGRDDVHEPTLDEVLASLRRSRVDSLRPSPLLPALSAPLLGQVFRTTHRGP